MALAWKRDERARCSGCDTRPEDWTDAAGRVLDPPRLMADQTVCWGCRELDLHRKAQGDKPEPGARARLVAFDAQRLMALADEDGDEEF